MHRVAILALGAWGQTAVHTHVYTRILLKTLCTCPTGCSFLGLNTYFCAASSQAIFKLIPKEEQSRLPEDENTPEKRANKLWSFFEKKDNGEGNPTQTCTTINKQKTCLLGAEQLFFLFLSCV